MMPRRSSIRLLHKSYRGFGIPDLSPRIRTIHCQHCCFNISPQYSTITLTAILKNLTPGRSRDSLIHSLYPPMLGKSLRNVPVGCEANKNPQPTQLSI